MTIYNLYYAYNDGDTNPTFDHLGTFLTVERLEEGFRIEVEKGRWARVQLEPVLLYASRESQVDALNSLDREGFVAETIEI